MKRGLVMGTAAVMLLGGALFVSPTQAVLADEPKADRTDTSKVKVYDVKVQKRSGAGGVDAPVRDNDQVYVTWKWSTEGMVKQPAVGDSFYFTISDAYFLLDSAPFDLEFAPGVRVGNCVVGQEGGYNRKITCTFDDGLAAQYQQGKTFVHGTGWFYGRASKAVAENSTAFDLNGVPTQVANPGNQPIGAIQYSFAPVNLAKSSDGVRSNSASISWNVSFTGDKLAARFPNGVPDTIVFKDRLSDGHVYTDHISFQALKTPDRPGIHQRRIYWKSIPSANSGFPMVTPEDNIGEFTVEYSFNPEQTEATFKITKLSGEWSPNVQYRGCQIVCVSGLLSERLFDYEYDD